jgi:hypothetical protein
VLTFCHPIFNCQGHILGKGGVAPSAMKEEDEDDPPFDFLDDLIYKMSLPA